MNPPYKEMMDLIYHESCPLCGWGDVCGDDIDVDHAAMQATQECYCDKCDGAWVEMYNLVAVRVLKG